MENQLSLAEIHTRSSGKLPDKWDLYLQIYEQVLSKYRDDDLNLLEIDVQNGGSLETWGIYLNGPKISLAVILTPSVVICVLMTSVFIWLSATRQDRILPEV